MSSNRVDASHDVTYPATSDARGSARIHHKRRPYYLGPHDSPLSYVMFGLWKQHLQETGEPPSTKQIRPLAEQLLAQNKVNAPVATGRQPKTVNILAAACVCLTIITGIAIFSSDATPKVDEVVLSESEADVIRTIRARSSVSERIVAGPYDSIAAMTQKLMDEGIADGARHVAGKDF